MPIPENEADFSGIVGVDSRLDAIHLSQHRVALTHYQDLSFLQLDLLNPLFVEEVGTFDRVTAIHLLEHLPEAQLPLAFQRLLQVTRHRLMVVFPMRQRLHEPLDISRYSPRKPWNTGVNDVWNR